MSASPAEWIGEPFMGRLSLSLIGPFAAALDGRPLQGFRSQKARALLAYLAAEPDQDHPRPLLAALLWPELPDRAALGNLRTALWNLREISRDRKAASPLFVVTTGTIRFSQKADVQVDLTTFLHLTRAEELNTPLGESWPAVARLEEAATLYRGPFLRGFFVDSAPFEEWVLLRREQTQRRVVETLRYLAAAYEQFGDSERALFHARRHVEIDRWEEEAHQRVMRLAALLGRRGAALAQYETCRGILVEELGVAPSPATEALATAIRQGHLDGTPPACSATEQAAERRAVAQLPAPATPLFGREREMVEIAALFGDRVRLLSIVGPGGIGKTRLALEIAHRPSIALPDGVAFVDLTGVEQPEAIPSSIANTLNLTGAEPSAPNLKARLLAYLRQRAMLLVLDNFEHLLAAAPLLAEIVAAAPGVSVLVTSRERLKLQTEHVYILQGFADWEWETLAQAAEDPAVQLFLYHARRVRPSFVLRDEHLQPLRTILELVQAMPLALILAAAWVEVMSPAEIATGIRQSLDFLEAPYRDLPPRQQSLRALFEGTWNRLEDRQQQLFASLTVFCGGFTLAAAEEVTGANPHDLLRFVERSMLARVEGGRFAMHELLRQYAAEQLRRWPDEERAVRERHARFTCRFLEQQAAPLRGAGAEKARAAIAENFENARAAWNWAADHRDIALLEQGMILGFYCAREGRRAEWAAMCQRAVERLSGTTSGAGRRVLAILLTSHSVFARGVLPFEQRHQALTEALAHLAAAAAFGEDVRYEKAMTFMALGQLFTGADYRRARSFLQASLPIFEELEAWYERANVHNDLAETYEAEADYATALDLARKALRQWEMVGEEHWINTARLQVALIKAKLGDVEQGVHEIREAAARFESAGNRFFAARAELALGDALVSLGRFDEGLATVARSQAYFTGMGTPEVSRAAWCWAALHQGHFAEVWRQSQVLLAGYRQVGTAPQIAEAAFLHGCAALALGNADRAVTALQTSVASGRASGRPAMLSRTLAVSACAALFCGNAEAARQQLVESLRLASERRLPVAGTIGLSTAVLLLAEQEEGEQAMALYELARREPFVARSCWFAEIFGRRMADLATTLSRETGEAARKQSAMMDRWRAVDALVRKLG
ncbi:MAG: BTAD domain-containing putative transcriptional regulator [Anaerolineae bacterium]|nr:BTAD domain-containing putative transcriptional regulator [Anaerolineae bacterium]